MGDIITQTWFLVTEEARAEKQLLTAVWIRDPTSCVFAEGARQGGTGIICIESLS